MIKTHFGRLRLILSVVLLGLIQENKHVTDGHTDGRTNQRTDRRMDQPMKGHSFLQRCVDECKNYETKNENSRNKLTNYLNDGRILNM